MSLLHLNDGNFKKEVLESSLPVLVDFWAPWCAPCKMIAPIIDEIAKDYKDRLKVGKVNVDESPKVSSHYGIMSIPTIMFFKQGKVLEQAVGILNKNELKKKIEESIL